MKVLDPAQPWFLKMNKCMHVHWTCQLNNIVGSFVSGVSIRWMFVTLEEAVDMSTPINVMQLIFW